MTNDVIVHMGQLVIALSLFIAISTGKKKHLDLDLKNENV